MLLDAQRFSLSVGHRRLATHYFVAIHVDSAQSMTRANSFDIPFGCRGISAF